MREMKIAQSLFYLPKNASEVAVFTTNGVVKKDGLAVCGAGIAKEANALFNISKMLGEYITEYGNRPFYLGKYIRTDEDGQYEMSLASFPTKNHWREKSDITLITKSAIHMVEMADKFGWTKIYLPPVGCGLGQLNFNCTVKPVLQGILDDRFVTVFGQSSEPFSR